VTISDHPVWSPDGKRIAFLSSRELAAGQSGPALWMMETDGSNPRRISGPSGAAEDRVWGDIVWSSDDWILFVVAEDIGGCYKARIDKMRPDGTARTRVIDGEAASGANERPVRGELAPRRGVRCVATAPS
jgi:Tol biopolymer transport system component